MYNIFRCNCGRFLYGKDGVATRKCVCGKTLKMKERRIFKKVRTREEATEAVQKMQAETFGNTDFKLASDL